jgi:hypothetical protein
MKHRFYSLINLREGEGRRVLFLMLYLLVICTGTSMGIAISTSMLLSEVGATKLPLIFIGISCVALLASSLYSHAVARQGSRRVYRFFLLSALVWVLACNVLIRADFAIEGIRIGIFLQYMGFFLLLGIDIMHYSTYVQEFLNPVQKKRLFSFILSATKLGGILGGVLLEPLVRHLGQVNVLLFWAGAYLAGYWVLRLFELGESAPSRKPGGRKKLTSFWSGLSEGSRSLFLNPFLFWFSVVIALDVFTGSFMVYQFNEGLIQDFAFAGRPEELSVFLGRFAAVANGISLILQGFLAPRIIARLGVTGTNLIYPLVSIGVLALSLWVWNLPMVAMLMFHKDFFMSALHSPNRFLFYNAIEPERRAFFLGFLDGTWSHVCSLLAGVFLIAVVEWGLFNLGSRAGFATAFSILGLGLFLFYLIAARKLSKAYRKQLFELVAQKDLGRRIQGFRLSGSEWKKFKVSQDKPVEVLEFLPLEKGSLFEELYDSFSLEERWKLFSLRPKASRSVLKLFSKQDHEQMIGELSSQVCQVFDGTPDGQKLGAFFGSKSLERSKTLESCLYLAIQDRRDWLPCLEGFLAQAGPQEKGIIFDLFSYFEEGLSALGQKEALASALNSSIDVQVSAIRCLEFGCSSSLLSRLTSWFEASSPGLRQRALSVAVHVVARLQNPETVLSLYDGKSWSVRARQSWYDLFEVFESQGRLVLDEFRKRESLALLRLALGALVLEEEFGSESLLVRAWRETLDEQVRLVLKFFRRDFDPASLGILEKALFSPHGSRRYEAIELLQSAGDTELCRLLSPFLESSHTMDLAQEIQKNFTEISSQNLSDLLGDSLAGEDSWIRACALWEIGRKKLTEFRSRVLELKDSKQDLYSQEMAIHCLQSFEEQ